MWYNDNRHETEGYALVVIAMVDDRTIEKIYAAVLGKIIGVYMGRPFESWGYERIKETFGYVDNYVASRVGQPLVVVDDDISGTFAFLRALREHGFRATITSREIGQTWLNQIVEGKTILWWGGVGVSAEHTAYCNLCAGVPAPVSGSRETNGKIISEQIGAQIFIDGWALVSPGRPERAVYFAEQAARVSHDGEAVHAAKCVAAIEAMAFGERDMQTLLDRALRFVPADSEVARVAKHVRALREREADWERAFALYRQTYNYGRYGGPCHAIPNFGVVLIALLYGGDRFAQAQRIVNTLGWDTDCNAATVGCINGIRLGLAAITAEIDYRGPVADRLYVTAAQCSEAISDAVNETYEIVRIISAVDGASFVAPKGGARFHFSPMGSVQGFAAADDDDGVARLSNTDRRLRIDIPRLSADGAARISTPTFFAEDALGGVSGYAPTGSPMLHSGQTITYALAVPDGVRARPFVVTHTPDKTCLYGDYRTSRWDIPDTWGNPILEVGFEFSVEVKAHDKGARDAEAQGGEARDVVCFLDYLAIDGRPRVRYRPNKRMGRYYASQWISTEPRADTPVFWEQIIAVSSEGAGLCYTGGSGWRDYTVATTFMSDLCAYAGIAFRIHGLLNYYAFVLTREGDLQR